MGKREDARLDAILGLTLKAERGPGQSQRLVREHENVFGSEVIPPPLDLEVLAELPHRSSILLQCILAMVMNVDGYGWDLEYIGGEEQGDEAAAPGEANGAAAPVVPPGTESPAFLAEKSQVSPAAGNVEVIESPRVTRESPEVLEEERRIREFFETCNATESFQRMRSKLRIDIESTGNGYLEIVRNTRGDIVGLEHVPSATVRILPQDRVPELVRVDLVVPGGKLVRRYVYRRFRRYVQAQGAKKVYFKEAGDPRVISCLDGRVVEDPQTFPPEHIASELIHFGCVYNPLSPYFVPRFIGNLPAIRGARYSEIVNLNFFRDNAIPEMIVMVGGGGLTEASLRRIQEYFAPGASNAQRGRRVLVVEATSQGAPLDAQKSSVTLDVKPLTGYQQSDAQWLRYDEQNRDKIRSAFRLPSIFVGESRDMNFATAQASRITAEEQVFQPERVVFDEIINTTVLRQMGVRYWRFYSKAPEIADVSTYVGAMQAFERVGAMTPNQAIELQNELLGTNREPITEPWGDYPFSMVLTLLQQGRLKGLDEIVEAQQPGGMPGGDMLGMLGGAPPGGGGEEKPSQPSPPAESADEEVPSEGETPWFLSLFKSDQQANYARINQAPRGRRVVRRLGHRNRRVR